MSIDTDYAVLRGVLPRVPEWGWAAEFGVYSGYSLDLIAAYKPVIGFDSFEGLPEDWREGFPKGMFDMSKAPGVRVGFPPPKSMLVPGWFEDTVPDFEFPKLSLVHIDCDLYSSTATALEGVACSIGLGTIFVFDEFHGYPGWEDHEAKAWGEFKTRWLVGATELARGPEECAFVVDRIGDRTL